MKKGQVYEVGLLVRAFATNHPTVVIRRRGVRELEYEVTPTSAGRLNAVLNRLWDGGKVREIRPWYGCSLGTVYVMKEAEG